ncbi:unnamed protein product [Acanthoscelides obtectus]|uniref:DUF4371 domain-containing protein n=1 Tax=Acanthoscelides obtectus TaxID=200917 RepID=A0A9P0M042_ACAOB|nr:unnamed protein product [Acanthoscelides obtectus]CAK1667824.1 Zinc finger protein 862 [Acanthoscelides obtectus]
MGLPVLKVKQDVPTRWNSCLVMLERLLVIKDSLSITITSISSAPEFLDAQEWTIIKDLIPILKPVEVITTILSGEKYPTMSSIIPLIRGLQHALVRFSTENEVCTLLKNDLVDIISRRLGILEVNKTVAKCSFLDPRFKKLGFGNETNSSNAQKWVFEELVQLIRKKNELNINDLEENRQEDDLSNQNPSKDNDFGVWLNFDTRFLKKKKEPTTEVASTSAVSSSENTDSMTSSEEIPSTPQVEKKRKKHYKQKFRSEWIRIYPWLEEKKQQSFCKACSRFIAGGFKHLGRHASSQTHEKNIIKAKKTPTIENYCENNDVLKSVRRAELKLTMFIHEHNLPFILMDHLILLLSVICPDSTIAKELKCARTKATNLTRCIAEEHQFSMSQLLQKQKFSLIVDETTDISSQKSLVVVARYFDVLQNRSKEVFLGLVRVLSADAESLFKAICDHLKQLNIPLDNMLGLAADNASVMMGHISGVQARFRTILPNIFILGCVCHSFHLCSSAAAKKLPRTLEDFIRSIYNYFAHSSKRKEKLEEFQKFVDLKPPKILHPCQTRWLSLQAAVDRLLENWDALRLFFQSEYLEEDLHATKSIMDSLENPIFKVYFTFLSYVLEQIALSGEVGSIALDAQMFFPNLISDIEKLNSEWRLLPDIAELKNIDQNSVDDFWSKVLKLKNAMNEDMFPHLEKLIIGI